ncbi:MAG: SpoIIE family protein phosphatase [Opitutaceae bacterium]|nr:SpoIIE family protein phosphatase [Cytophagales bacterium]
MKIVEDQNLISNITDQAWKSELENASSKYHIIGAWLAIIFNPLFAFTDYVNLPLHWMHLASIRLTISVITLLILLSRKKTNIPSYLVILVPFLLISLQNAYTFSLVGPSSILEHSINYIALLIGGAMFILWRWTYSVLVVVLSAKATLLFVHLNSGITKEQFMVKGGFLLLAVGIFMIILIKARYDLTIKEIKARLALKASNEELGRQKDIVEKSNLKITDSIKYAKRIQDSILGNLSRMESWFPGSFVLFMPKDILSGDFYWMYEDKPNQVKIVIAADCTGHGVPAAMMTVLANSILNEVVIQGKIYSPDTILYSLDQKIAESLNSRSENEEKINDGMDVSILCFTPSGVSYAAAKNPLFIINGTETQLIAASKFPIGSTQYGDNKIFEKHDLLLSKGAKLYMYSDGFPDQFGGPDNKKYLSKRFREFLLKTSNLSMIEQKLKLTEEFILWKGEQSINTDDVLVIGIQV